jgi:hypothetical protein
MFTYANAHKNNPRNPFYILGNKDIHPFIPLACAE